MENGAMRIAPYTKGAESPNMCLSIFMKSIKNVKGEINMEPIHITSESFDTLLKEYKIVIVDFWADWCGPCKMLGPIIAELAGALDGRAVVGKLNVDEYGDIAARYGIQGIPTVLFFKDGKVAEKAVGFRQKAQLMAIAESLMVI